MKQLLITALTAYVIATIHSILAFANKRLALERISQVSLAVGFIIHTISLVLDGIKDGRYPILFLDETLSFLSWTLVVTYALVIYRYRIQALGIFTLPLIALLTLAATITRETPNLNSSTVSNNVDSWFLPIHTTLLLFAYASFFVVFVAGVMYLLQERELKMKTFTGLFHRFPSLNTIDDIGSTATGIGFTLLTFGILTGMLWSSYRDGRIWHNDPKELFTIVTWLLYLVLVHYRYTAKWYGRKAAWLGVLGFALVLCTFLGTRLMGGYHVFG
jgi:cytochrome c-type biogenesis protein CcsB